MKTSLTKHSSRSKSKNSNFISTLLKIGDKVMVIAGGNSIKKPIKSKTGTIKNFVGDKKQRVIVEGIDLNITVHLKAKSAGETSRKEIRPGSVHISNVMYYSDKLSKPVRLKKVRLLDGKVARAYTNPETKSIEHI